jgi:hypothetical protein
MTPLCTCYPTPEHMRFVHYGATEPGSALEPNYDCTVHFPEEPSEPLSRGRVWFYRPQRWFYWNPLLLGHDEFARRTLVIGWPFTGQVVIALGWCGDVECIRERDEMLERLGEEPWSSR